jgi:hypothetical protein
MEGELLIGIDSLRLFTFKGAGPAALIGEVKTRDGETVPTRGGGRNEFSISYLYSRASK